MPPEPRRVQANAVASALRKAAQQRAASGGAKFIVQILVCDLRSVGTGNDVGQPLRFLLERACQIPRAGVGSRFILKLHRAVRTDARGRVAGVIDTANAMLAVG